MKKRRKTTLQKKYETILSDFCEKNNIPHCYMFVNIIDFEKIRKDIVKIFGLPDTKCNCLMISDCLIYECKIAQKGKYIIVKPNDLNEFTYKTS